MSKVLFSILTQELIQESAALKKKAVLDHNNRLRQIDEDHETKKKSLMKNYFQNPSLTMKNKETKRLARKLGMIHLSNFLYLRKFTFLYIQFNITFISFSQLHFFHDILTIAFSVFFLLLFLFLL